MGKYPTIANDVESQWMIDYLVNKKDADKYSRGSHSKVLCKCPHCGMEKEITVFNFFKTKSMGCFCSTKMSNGERIVAKILEKNNIDFEYDSTTKWSKRKRYDFIFTYKDINYIIEVNGRQHKEECVFYGGQAFYDKQKDADDTKRKLAEDNIENLKYITIDCWKDNGMFDEVFDIIITNNDIKIFLDNINTQKLKEEVICSKPYLVQVCEYYNKNQPISPKEIKEQLNLCVSHRMIKRLLEKGNEIGICDYTADRGIDYRKQKFNNISKHADRSNWGKRPGWKVEVFDSDWNSLGIYEDAETLSKVSEQEFGMVFPTQTIKKRCNPNNGYKIYKNKFYFKWVI